MSSGKAGAPLALSAGAIPLGGVHDGEHMVLTYSSQPQLVRDVCDFLKRGLDRNQLNALLVTRVDSAGYLAGLREEGIDADALVDSQDIVLVEVDELVASSDITAIIRSIEARVAELVNLARAKGKPGLNVVGTVAGGLASQGRFQECILLEKRWQEILENSSLPITLLCPYSALPSVLEEGLEGTHKSLTKLISADPEKMRRFVLDFIQRARTNDKGQTLDFVGDRYAPHLALSLVDAVTRVGKMSQRFRFRMLTSIEPENARDIRMLAGMAGVEIRHIKWLNYNFCVSGHEYLAAPVALREGLPDEILWSNSSDLAAQMKGLFEMVWRSAIPAEVRLEELRQGDPVGETRITFDHTEITEVADGFVDEMKEEALLLLPRAGSLKDNSLFFQRIAAKARNSSVRVRVLGTFSSDDVPILRQFESAGAEIRRLSPNQELNMVLGIYDRKYMGMVQYLFPRRSEEKRSVGPGGLSGILSSNPATIAGIAAIFDSLWEESDLRESAETMRKKAELMQDIMAHDIKNYNQVAMANAEILMSRVKDESLRSSISMILEAVKGSTALVQRARQLASIMSQKDAPLAPVVLNDSIARALSLIRMGNPSREIELRNAHGHSPVAWVVADELLDEIFVNVLSNAVKYTASTKVLLDLRLEEDEVGGKQFWSVTITDRGSGIPDAAKENVTTRYLGTSRGRGLGLSIIRALAVDRYKGALEIRDRVDGDYSKGTSVVVRLPKASH